MSPFETQKRSRWFENMQEQAKYAHLITPSDDWSERAIKCIEPAGFCGAVVTAPQLTRELEPMIGPPPNRQAVNTVVRRLRRNGCARKLDSVRKDPEDYRANPEYEIGTDLTAALGARTVRRPVRDMRDRA